MRPSVWNSLSKIQEALGLSDQAFAQMLRLSETEFHQRRLSGVEPSAYSGMALCDELEIGFDLLLNDGVDLNALVRQRGIDPSALPEKYTVGATSRRLPVMYILDYIERKMGRGYRSFLLRQFQVRELAVRDPNALVNVKLGIDIVSFKLDRYQDDRMAIAMGRNSATFSRDTPLGKELRLAKNLREVFDVAVDYALEKYVTKNYRYKITYTDSFRCVMEGTPDKSLLPLVGSRYLYSRENCLVRTGFISAIPCFLDYPPVAVRKTSCVCQGDKVCRYELDFFPLIRYRGMKSKLAGSSRALVS